MSRTMLTPSENGFHFSNNDVEWQFLLPFIRGKNVCGGMCYGVLDYWYNTQSPPSTKIAPPLGTRLNEYLTDRQMEAHKFAIPRVVRGIFFQSHEDLFNRSFTAELPRIQASIRIGAPIPILLIRDHMLDCHFVLAIGFNPFPVGTRWSVQVYDPNQPDKITDFIIDPPTGTITLSGDGNVTRGFFADTSYAFEVPPFIPDAARPTPAPFARSPYLVEEGDTLDALAGRFYGFEDRWTDIHEANRWVVGRNGYRLKAGQILTIPD